LTCKYVILLCIGQEDRGKVVCMCPWKHHDDRDTKKSAPQQMECRLFL